MEKAELLHLKAIKDRLTEILHKSVNLHDVASELTQLVDHLQTFISLLIQYPKVPTRQYWQRTMDAQAKYENVRDAFLEKIAENSLNPPCKSIAVYKTILELLNPCLPAHD